MSIYECRQKRLAEFNGPIAEIAVNNVAVNQIAQSYARGDIVTREEALSQMVVALARNWTEVQRRAMEGLLRTGM